ncbi:sugar phosphate isomerase/epimerase [Listeria welshimeri]|uniref:Xylose isomerase-like TIM barrel domain-containing protein n=1 Tax=Listeria welshimeri serovar 6b (strain ATCC 35897 / DSM 20650 / CCUG 15529 / CIP 8149 / NCTC 11857 / SLCC 5334 / V8) TaxID=386043 RepID=A0AKR4_LISW6|nr:sugar phosphate isomerase/epimerase [Listeria welshimeri]MBC1341103.1 sugar phosphate isomerase/epimerase [Listeria welshimeri]MBC1346648.1 sugar phosphate isomerase/epimerase [Listeria welshimeri]MBC1349531.1 sugar phosphate isomerase/epimerase [Listeria welshimeri]MBC1396119.1 sugar phosphate isomerase/epimerase [Listeria welshimeri]MBC1448431.1 sugar phosphate isomerase/epimerase [Listeria welshimeri]
MKAKIALQLWSVKEACEDDFFGTLEKVAEMGYDGVEFAGYYGKSASEIKTKLAELGLEVAGSHISKEMLEAELEDVIVFERELGNKFIICPYADFETKQEWLSFAEKLREIAKTIQQAGMQFGYHNHAHELEKVDDAIILENLLGNVPEMIAELDTYWIEYAGVGVIPFIEKYRNRVPLVHIKDKSKTSKESTIIGEGILDISGYVKTAIASGTKWLIIEQEAFEEDPLTSVAKGYTYLANVLEGK